MLASAAQSSKNITSIRAGLAASLDPKIVNELLEAYAEAKKNYYLGGQRLAEVEGGRFCEAAFRLLQQQAGLAVTPLGKKINSDRVIQDLANLPSGTAPESVRLHIPRALRVVYDVRNNRDAAHLGDGIDPNLQDASLVVSTLDWVLAEFVRLHHSVPADEAQRIVEDLVTRKAPVVQEFHGFLKVLNTSQRGGVCSCPTLPSRCERGELRGTQDVGSTRDAPQPQTDPRPAGSRSRLCPHRWCTVLHHASRDP